MASIGTATDGVNKQGTMEPTIQAEPPSPALSLLSKPALPAFNTAGLSGKQSQAEMPGVLRL